MEGTGAQTGGGMQLPELPLMLCWCPSSKDLSEEEGSIQPGILSGKGVSLE